MKRVCVIGCCASGKSTFSCLLAKRIKLPLIHLDQIFWKPNWQEEERDVFDQKLKSELNKDEWIIDGHYTRTIKSRVQKSDTVFFFDYPTHICLFRYLKRIFQYRKNVRPDMADNCKEHFNWHLLRYITSFKFNKRPGLIKTLEDHAQHCKVIVFKCPSELKAWLENFNEQNRTNI